MLVKISSYRSRQAADLAAELNLDIVIVADKQTYLSSLERTWDDAVADGRRAMVDFRWYRPATETPAWFTTFAGRSRSEIERSDAMRRRFFELVARRFAAGPLVSPSGQANDIARSIAYARQMVEVRDAEFSDRQVLMSITLNRRGLTDQVLASLVPPTGTQGVVLTVLDSVKYPSHWSEDEWFVWLRLIAALSRGGYSLVLSSCDVRGLVARGLCDADLVTGFTQEDRQTPADPGTSTGGGGAAPVSYLSAPLLTIMHGERLAVDASARVAETHSRAQPYGTIACPVRGTAFDPDWQALDQPVGERIRRRLRRHIKDFAAIESWIDASPNNVDAVESILTHAASLRTRIPGDVFRNAANRDEIVSRARAFRRVIEIDRE